MEDQRYFSKFVCIDPFQCQFQVPSDKDVLVFLVQKGDFSVGNFMACFSQQSGNSAAVY